MNLNPKISIVMPVFNGGRYIQRAIESALGQQYPAHELIIIDDGSTDGTPGVLKSYGDRIITRRIPQSGGPATPKNTGMSLATGDYIAFLDHDDVWFKNKLAAQVEMVRRYPEIGFFACNYAVRYNHLGNRMVNHFEKLRNFSQMTFNEPFKQHPFLTLIKENFVGTTSTAMIRRDIIEKAGVFSTTHGFCEDYLYWFQCAPHTNFVLSPEMLLYKRTHSTNVSLNTLVMYELHRKVLETVGKEYGRMIDENGWRKTYVAVLADHETQLGNLYYEMRNYPLALAFYAKALSRQPNPRGFAHYLWTVLKKSLRFVTFDKVSKKSLAANRRSR